MRLATILKLLVVLVVAVVVGGVVVLMTMDFNQYKGLIAEKVKEATGRDLAIEGDIKLTLVSLSPALAVNGVKFQNAPWGSKPSMATVERFEAQVALIPLLSKQVVVDHVILKNADFLIERDKQGRVNYDFETAEDPGKAELAKPETGSSGSEAGALQLPVVHKVRIEDATLTYADATSGQRVVLALKKVAIEGQGPESPVELTVDGTYNDARFKADGELGPPNALTDPGKSWPVKLNAEAGGARIKVEGAIQDVTAVAGLHLTVSAEGKSMAGLSEFTGSPVPPLGPYSVVTSVRGDLARTIRLEEIAAKVGKSDLGGKLAVQLASGRPVVTGAFKSSLIDLADFTGMPGGGADTKSGAGGAAGGGDAPAGKPALASPDDRIFPADRLPVEALKAADADIALDAKRVLLKGAAMENVKLGLGLQAGRLKLDPLKAELSKGTVDGRVQFDGATQTPALDASLKAAKIDLGKLLTDMEITDLLEGAANADVAVKGHGKSVRELMGGLNGDVKLVLGEGRVKTNALDAFIGGPTQIVGRLVSGEKKEYTVLNCVVSQTEIRNGLASLKVAAIDTEYARITGKGSVNLGTEQIDIAVVPEPKSATLNLAVGVKVGGTLADPHYGIDELSALRKFGGAVVGFGFPPAMLLGLGEVGASSDNPCLKPGEAGAQQAPSGSSNPVEKATEGVGNMLKGLFGK